MRIQDKIVKKIILNNLNYLLREKEFREVRFPYFSQKEIFYALSFAGMPSTHVIQTQTSYRNGLFGVKTNIWYGRKEPQTLVPQNLDQGPS